MKLSRLKFFQNMFKNDRMDYTANHKGFISAYFTLIILCCLTSIVLWSGISLAEKRPVKNSRADTILIERLSSGSGGGQAYRLTYTAPVPIDVYWRFKTDFDNDFLKENKFILSHRFISRDNDTVITENEYTSKPNVIFRWKTTISPLSFRLDFVLLNPESTGHDFHYGHIILYPQGDTTKVVQEAHFNFFGASLWAIYPWSGGMTEFLKYTARWEQDMVLKISGQYVR